jgi:rubrerythrin
MGNIRILLEESAQFEMDAYEIYSIFKGSNENDAEFWGQLANEELDHAGLLTKCLPLCSVEDEIACIISVDEIELIKEARRKIHQFMIEFQKNPSPSNARDMAIEVENSIIENSYQKFMDAVPNSDLKQLFQLLNGKEKDHVKRIVHYYQSK